MNFPHFGRQWVKEADSSSKLLSVLALSCGKETMQFPHTFKIILSLHTTHKYARSDNS